MSRILVVDDKDENVYYLEVLLRGHGHVVDTARHGAEALTVARRTRPDLVVSDLLMPVMDGYTLVRRWKADPSLAPIPFIVYTATYTEAADEQLALDLGADAFILKPAEPDEFVARVDEVARRAEVRRPVGGSGPGGDGSDPAPVEDPVLLKTYSETLIRKLEEKTFQLEEANEALRQDIAERQRVEAALREREAEIRTLIESLPQLVWIAGPDGRTIDVNQQWLDVTGLGREECIERGWELALHPDDYEASSERWAEAMRTEAPYQEEYRLRAADGSYRWMLSRAVALRDEHGATLRWFGTCTDIDDLKRAEANLLRTQRLESIGTLAGGIAHDLNNLLSPILVGSELLRLQHDDPPTVQLLDTIDTSARRGADLVRQVLAFARGFGGERITVDLSDVVDEVMAIVTSTFPKSIEVVVEVADGLPTVLGDPTQLHQVLLNLCVNARDAMPDGGTLTIRVNGPVTAASVIDVDGDPPAGTEFVVLRVTDDGVGIPADMLDRIFEPFLTTKVTGGSGLGLSTVLGIVRGHGGAIDVRSTPGAGSTFEVSLPVGEADTPVMPGVAFESGTGRGRLVLVVDDESAVRETIRQVLEAAGFRAALAADGAEALAMFSSRRADVCAVLTDVMMPGLDGADLVDAVRLLDTGMPMVVMSGAAAPDVERRLASLDRVTWVEKPFTSAELLGALYRLVG